MGRWIAEEEAALKILKEKIKQELADAPQFPELVGDRRLIRFLRGRDNDPELAAGMYRNHLKWRMDMNVNEIRNKIAYGGINDPMKFPRGDVIIRAFPQIVIAPYACDYVGQPMVLEQYGFNPKEVLSLVSIDDYVIFLIYSLEYRSMILEQLSDVMEHEYLQKNPNPADGYGVVLKICCIRDLKGLGMNHMNSTAKLIIQKALDLATPNYQEFLGKSHMINVPWVFNALWQFITYQGWLEPSTIAKIASYGADYLEKLQKDVPMSSIPVCVGGKLQAYNEPFDFDLGVGGALYWADGPKITKPAHRALATATATAAAPKKDLRSPTTTTSSSSSSSAHKNGTSSSNHSGESENMGQEESPTGPNGINAFDRIKKQTLAAGSRARETLLASPAIATSASKVLARLSSPQRSPSLTSAALSGELEGNHRNNNNSHNNSNSTHSTPLLQLSSKSSHANHSTPSSGDAKRLFPLIDDDIQDHNNGGVVEGGVMTGHHTDKGYPQGGGSTPIHTPTKTIISSISSHKGGNNDDDGVQKLKKSGNDDVLRGINDPTGHGEMESSASDQRSLYGLEWLMDKIGLSTLYSHNSMMAIGSVIMVMWVIFYRPCTFLFLALPIIIYSWLA